MTYYEILTLVLAALAAITSVTSIIRTRRIAEKQLEYQAIAAALAKAQLAVLKRQEGTLTKADVTVELVKVGRTDFRFVISNRRAVPATDVTFTIAEDSPDNPLIRNECERKLPYPKLEPGQSFTLIAALHLRSAMQYATRLAWRSPDGIRVTRDVHVAL